MLDSFRAAELHYGMYDYDVIRPGHYVLCAVTGERVALRELKYWSSVHQEAYRGPKESTAASLAGGAANLKK